MRPFTRERSGNASANSSAASIDNGVLVFEKHFILLPLDRLRWYWEIGGSGTGQRMDRVGGDTRIAHSTSPPPTPRKRDAHGFSSLATIPAILSAALKSAVSRFFVSAKATPVCVSAQA